MRGKSSIWLNSTHLKSFLQHEEILEVQRPLFAEKQRSRAITQKIHSLKEELRDEIGHFFEKFHFDILVVQNALAISILWDVGGKIWSAVDKHLWVIKHIFIHTLWFVFIFSPKRCDGIEISEAILKITSTYSSLPAGQFLVITSIKTSRYTQPQ